jgi:hypothetical protein|tara:strand:+ start:497 stop:652 length:156 start_codon:yes stop_codon:yes gene_type:complete
MDWQTIIQNLSLFTIGTAALTWIVKSVITQLINKDFEKYKSKLFGLWKELL